MHKLAKYNYYPGWQQQFTVVDFIVQKVKWDGLSKSAKTIFEITCNNQQFIGHARSNSLQPDAMRKLEKEGVTFITWKASDLKKLERAWDKVAEEISAENQLFEKVYSKYNAFRKQYAIWGEKAYLKLKCLDVNHDCSKSSSEPPTGQRQAYPLGCLTHEP